MSEKEDVRGEINHWMDECFINLRGESDLQSHDLRNTVNQGRKTLEASRSTLETFNSTILGVLITMGDIHSSGIVSPGVGVGIVQDIIENTYGDVEGISLRDEQSLIMRAPIKVDLYSFSLVILQELSNREIASMLHSLTNSIGCKKRPERVTWLEKASFAEYDKRELDKAFSRISTLMTGDTKHRRYLEWIFESRMSNSVALKNSVVAVQSVLKGTIEDILDSMTAEDPYWRRLKKILCVRLFLKYSAFLSGMLSFYPVDLPIGNMFDFMLKRHHGLMVPDINTFCVLGAACTPQMSSHAEDYASRNYVESSSSNSARSMQQAPTLTTRHRYMHKTLSTGTLQDILSVRDTCSTKSSSSYRQDVLCLHTLAQSMWNSLREAGKEDYVESLCYGKYLYARNFRKGSRDIEVLNMARHSGVHGGIVRDFKNSLLSPMVLGGEGLLLGETSIVSDKDLRKIILRISNYLRKDKELSVQVSIVRLSRRLLMDIVRGYLCSMFQDWTPGRNGADLFDFAMSEYLLFKTTGEVSEHYSHLCITLDDEELRNKEICVDYADGTAPLRHEDFTDPDAGQLGRYSFRDELRCQTETVLLSKNGEESTQDITVITVLTKVVLENLTQYLCFRLSDPVVMKTREAFMGEEAMTISGLLLGEMVYLLTDWANVMENKILHSVSTVVQTAPVHNQELDFTSTYPVITNRMLDILSRNAWYEEQHSSRNYCGVVIAPYLVRTALSSPEVNPERFGKTEWFPSLRVDRMDGLFPTEMNTQELCLREGQYLANMDETPVVIKSPPIAATPPPESSLDIRFLYHPVVQETAYRRVAEAIVKANDIHKTLEKLRC